MTSCKSDKAAETQTAADATTPSAQPVATTDANGAPVTTTTTTTPSGTNVTVNSPTPVGVGSTPAGAEAATPTGPTTNITFKETSFDYGKVKDGDMVKHAYKFTNSGKEPLIISDAKGSCGCTVPTWPKDPIAPGATGEIMVEFNSKGKLGPQSKKVTLSANTNPAQTYLTIKGEVVPAK
jgi:hypothetical protein